VEPQRCYRPSAVAEASASDLPESVQRTIRQAYAAGVKGKGIKSIARILGVSYCAVAAVVGRARHQKRVERELSRQRKAREAAAKEAEAAEEEAARMRWFFGA
jgi:hypothetical protein